MTRIDHERARELALDARIDEIALSDRRWLNAHLSDCAECTEFISSLDKAVGMVRMSDVTATVSLVRATQSKVRRRALELQSHAAAMRPLWIAAALVCATTALTTSLLWAAFAWLGTALSLSRLEWSAGFIFAWFAPTLAASFLLIASGMNRAKVRTVIVRSTETV